MEGIETYNIRRRRCLFCRWVVCGTSLSGVQIVVGGGSTVAVRAHRHCFRVHGQTFSRGIIGWDVVPFPGMIVHRELCGGDGGGCCFGERWFGGIGGGSWWTFAIVVVSPIDAFLHLENNTFFFSFW